jgi:hypothetical protein
MPLLLRPLEQSGHLLGWRSRTGPCRRGSLIIPEGPRNQPSRWPGQGNLRAFGQNVTVLHCAEMKAIDSKATVHPGPLAAPHGALLCDCEVLLRSGGRAALRPATPPRSVTAAMTSRAMGDIAKLVLCTHNYRGLRPAMLACTPLRQLQINTVLGAARA